MSLMTAKDKRLEVYEDNINHDVEPDLLLASSSASGDAILDFPPPPFEDEPSASELHHPENISGAGGEPPPDFTPYEADYFQTGSGDTVSHDPHLNGDGMQ